MCWSCQSQMSPRKKEPADPCHSQLLGQEMGQNLSTWPSVGHRVWVSGGCGWDQAEARQEVRQEWGRDATGQEGRCGYHAEQTIQETRELSSEARETKRRQDLRSQTWQEGVPGHPLRKENFKAADESGGARGPSLPGAHAKSGEMGGGEGHLVMHLRTTEGTETLLTSHLPGKMLRGGQTQLYEKVRVL